MTLRLHPAWWPAVAALSPALVPVVVRRTRRFRADRDAAARLNAVRLAQAAPLDLPELGWLEIAVLVDWRARPGFLGDEGVSYLLRSDRGSLLFDVAFGASRKTLVENVRKAQLSLGDVDAIAISHLHADHIGGVAATRAGIVSIPDALNLPRGRPCFVPAPAAAGAFPARVVHSPQMLPGGIGTTGPLARSLFFLGWTEEQALIARVRGKGLVIVTGCGHPTVHTILDMCARLSAAPVHAIVGGLHFPVTSGRGKLPGIQLQMILGTGKEPWRRINDEDLSGAIARMRSAGVRELYLSAHDTCDHALDRMSREVGATTEILQAGARYRVVGVDQPASSTTS